MNFANEQTIEQLQSLQVDGKYVELRAIGQNKTQQFFMNGNIEEALVWANARANDGADVYVGINPRDKKSGTREDVQTVTALYADLDLGGVGVEEAIEELLSNSFLQPNRIVRSGRGLHAYWHIEPTADKALWRKTNVALQQRFAHLKADKAVATDEARILRLVPYPNTKKDAGAVECITRSDKLYVLEDIAAQLKVTADDTRQPATANEIAPATSSLKMTLLRRAIEKGEPGNRNNSGYWLACQLRDNRVSEEEALEIMQQHVDNTEYPGGSYNYTEALRTLKSAYSGKPRDAWKPIVQSTPEGITQQLASGHQTDTGNAENFAAMFGSDARYNRTADKWLLWDGVRWVVDEYGKVERFATDTARAMLRGASEINDDDKRKRAVGWALSTENLQRRKAMLTIAQSIPPLATIGREFDTHHMLVTAKNGTIDLHTGELRPSERSEYLTKQLGTTYNRNADCPRWKQFLSEVFDNDQELIRYVQTAIGYSLTGDTREQVLFLLLGNGRNGKSTFLETIALLMGEYADTTSFATFDAGTKNEQSNDLAKLSGARFVTIIEADEDRRLNEAKVKSVTGQDTITCRFLHREFFSYKPQFKIWLAMNHAPIIRGADEGIWRRIKRVPFKQNFKDREDKLLNVKLHSELPGILNWALDGLRRWQEEGLIEPKAVTDATREYRAESDVIAEWIEDFCEIDSKYEMIVEVGYMVYRQWAEARNDKPMSNSAWSRRIQEMGYSRERIFRNGKQVRAFKGIKTDVSVLRGKT